MLYLSQVTRTLTYEYLGREKDMVEFLWNMWGFGVTFWWIWWIVAIVLFVIVYNTTRLDASGEPLPETEQSKVSAWSVLLFIIFLAVAVITALGYLWSFDG